MFLCSRQVLLSLHSSSIQLQILVTANRGLYLNSHDQDLIKNDAARTPGDIDYITRDCCSQGSQGFSVYTQNVLIIILILITFSLSLV